MLLDMKRSAMLAVTVVIIKAMIIQECLILLMNQLTFIGN
jgi:hypothetical protein